MNKYLLVGMGETNKAVSRIIKAGGGGVVATDDVSRNGLAEFCSELDIEFHFQPTPRQYADLLKKSNYCIPTPGLSDSHVIYKGLFGKRKFISELDIASSMTDAPIVAITGTNGKSTVVEMVKEALLASGIKAVACGNTELPFSAAIIENLNYEIFVVEASSFGLRHTRYFSPKVSAWLNFAPNHLDNHKNLKSYEKAKAKIWKRISNDDYWVVNLKDPIVKRNQPKKGQPLSFEGNNKSTSNINAVTLIATAAGANPEGIKKSILNFKGLPHRVQEVANIDGINWYDDSKATSPHAVWAGVSELDNVVLIAGGKDKAGNIGELNQLENVKALVCIGESADELNRAFKDVCPVAIASDMKEAVIEAHKFSQSITDISAVVLSPGGASFDWYTSYIERGKDFQRQVKNLTKEVASSKGKNKRNKNVKK